MLPDLTKLSEDERIELNQRIVACSLSLVTAPVRSRPGFAMVRSDVAAAIDNDSTTTMTSSSLRERLG